MRRKNRDGGWIEPLMIRKSRTANLDTHQDYRPYTTQPPSPPSSLFPLSPLFTPLPIPPSPSSSTPNLPHPLQEILLLNPPPPHPPQRPRDLPPPLLSPHRPSKTPVAGPQIPTLFLNRHLGHQTLRIRLGELAQFLGCYPSLFFRFRCSYTGFMSERERQKDR